VRRAAGLIAATLLTSVALAACGGSSAGLIPTNNAARLGDDLSSLATALDNHDCDGTQSELDALLNDINALPSSVSTKLSNNLLTGYEELDNTARVQCKAPAGSHTHPHTTGPTGPSQTTTSPTGVTQPETGPTPASTGPTGPTQPETGPSGSSIGPGGGSPAPPPGSSGDSGAAASSTGGAVSTG
jgi:hypothetical protein